MKEWLQPHVAEVLRDAEDDWIIIDNVIAYGWEGSTQARKDPREATVELFRFLLDQELMLVGDLGDRGFEAWTCSVDEAVKTFVEGCESYDWEPQGALWWLEITSKGRDWLARAA